MIPDCCPSCKEIENGKRLLIHLQQVSPSVKMFVSVLSIQEDLVFTKSSTSVEIVDLRANMITELRCKNQNGKTFEGLLKRCFN